jgi:hypothetical protein
MATITITEQDRLDAEVFLQAYLSELIPNADFSRGSFVHDLVIKSIAYTVAYLRAENRTSLDRSALARVKKMSEGIDRDEAADDAVSNWFITRKSGRNARGKILVHVSEKREILVPNTARFYYDQSRYFTPDYSTGKIITESDITEVAGYDGAVVDRYFSINVVAADVGESYSVAPTLWRTWDAFSPYVTKVENISTFAGGGAVETTDSMLVRAEEAICVRDLTSVRSIRTTLKENFSDVDDVYVAGAGTPELQRDLSTLFGGLTRFHVGGHTDVYIKGPVIDAPVYEADVGATFTDPRTAVVNFTAAGIADFSSVTPGAVLRVYNGTAAEPTHYVIERVHPKFLRVDIQNPFPGTKTDVDFSIGTNYPEFNNLFTRRVTGSFTRSFTLTRTVLLPQLPVYHIKQVSLYDVSAGQWVGLDRNKDPATALGASEFRLYYGDPQYAFSGYQLAYLEFGSDVSDLDRVRVEYETLSGFDSVHSYMSDSFNRIACANVMARAMFPVYITVKMRYKLRDPAVTVSESEMEAGIVQYVNEYPVSEPLNVSKLTGYVLSNWGNALAYAIPYVEVGPDKQDFKLDYELYAPNGGVIAYRTSGDVTVAAAFETATPVKLADPTYLGITANTLLYNTTPDHVSFTKDS